MIKTFSLLDLWGRLSTNYPRGHIKTKNLLREGTEPGEGLWKEMENDVQATP